MGPERKAPENRQSSVFTNFFLKLQWGRSERLRKTGHKVHGREVFGARFNGAGAKGSGKLLKKLGLAEKDVMLQWGRSERLRKTAYSIKLKRIVCQASMGPERKAPENSSFSRSGISNTHRFNGAGAKGSGKRVYRRTRTVLENASMGPERKAPENQPGSRKRVQITQLQWGRSERLRKTSI